MRVGESLRAMGLALLTSVAAGQSAFGQQPVPRPAGPRTLVGVVLDTLGSPVDSVEVLVGSVQRRTRSGSDGTFRFDDIKPGKYDVAARRPGYFPQVRSAVVDEKGGVVSFSLVRSVPALPPVVSSAPLGGLSGVIGDTAYNIVEGARISVVASDHRAQSDSMGRFFIGLKPGKYAVRVERAGYRSRLVSVTIPNDSGRRITVWLTPSTRAQDARDAMALDSLEMRLAIRNPVWSNIYTREDINRLGIEEGAQLARLGANSWKGSLDDRCIAVIDGGPMRAPLWSIDAANLEMMEVYSPRPNMGRVTSIKPGGTTARSPGADDYCDQVRVFVWLRK
jgi:hypothetical protein